MDASAEGNASKKYTSQRRTIDISSSYDRLYFLKKHGLDKSLYIEPESSYNANILPPDSYGIHGNGINMATKFTHLSSNKVKHVIPALTWTPEGRRLVVATYNGEFSLWSGASFNFESIMQAHDSAVTVMTYSHTGDWMVSGSADGELKIWQPNFNMVKVMDQAHMECVREISFSPTDQKFVSCSDDNVLKIWNFSNGQQERVLSGHHWDVKSCDWHPKMGLIISGSKDNLIKFWDPRSGSCVSTMLGFKHTIISTKFQPKQGNLFSVISKDKTCKVYDIRQQAKELFSVRDDVDYMTLQWHPIIETMFTVGCYDGSIKHFDLSQENQPNKPTHNIPYAHEKCVTSLAYSPIGHIMASASKDRTIRFWTRSRAVDPNAFDDPTYNNEKVNAWYFGINNNINAVRNKTEHGIALPPNEDENENETNEISKKIETERGPTMQLPGLSSGLPGLSF